MLPSYALDVVLARLGRLPDLPDPPRSESQAAVAIVLRSCSASPPGGSAAEGCEVLLMRRADDPRDPWSGHMAFPGGRRDPGDASALAAAMRETREEMGLDLARSASLIARLPNVPAMVRGKRLGLVIAPFVFALRPGAPAELSLNHEVAEALWTPLAPLARGELDGVYPYEDDGRRLALPCFDVGGRKVWGLTCLMLRSLVDALHAPDATDALQITGAVAGAGDDAGR